MIQILLPELGEGITSVEISDVNVKVGDNISIDDILIVVETDKASMEIPTTEAGKISTVHVLKGDTLSPGEAIITISEKGDTEKVNDEVIKDIPGDIIQEEIIERPNEETDISESFIQ